MVSVSADVPWCLEAAGQLWGIELMPSIQLQALQTENKVCLWLAGTRTRGYTTVLDVQS